MSEIDNVLQNSIEYLPNKIYYVALKSTVPPRPIPGVHFFSIDKELMYWNFYLDFGPLHLGHTIRFCNILNEKLKDPNISKKKIILFSLPGSNFRTNAACLLCCWGLLYNHMTPQESFLPFKNLTFPYFHDATPGLCTYKLTILDVLQGVNKAIQKKYLTLDTFNLNEYYYYEKVENGDLTWISKKFIAFAGPQDRTCGNDPLNSNSYAHTPEEYIPYFKQHDVTLVVRLNKKQYDERKFINAGIDHLDLVYNDGGNPTEYILKRFIDACDATPGVVAVHCKAGLGRTGTCIGCYIMSNDQFTSKEVIGWLRICRPGSVIGPQQQFMDEMESRLWKLGESKARSGNKKIEESMEKLQLNSTEPGSPKKAEIIADDLSQGDFLNTKKRDVQLQGAANIVQSLVK